MEKECYNIPMELPDEKQLWQEREELLKEESEDNFVQAKEGKMNPDEALVYVNL